MENLDNNNEEKKMVVCIMKPLVFMKKGDHGYFSSSNWYLVYKGDSFENMRIYLYIMKNATYTNFKVEGFLEVERISDDNNGFFIHFNKTTHYSLYLTSNFKESDYLPPIEIDYMMDDGKEPLVLVISYDQYNFVDLIDLLWEKMENGNFSMVKSEVSLMIEAIPSTLKKYISDFDQEGMMEMRHNINMEEEESLEMLIEGEKKKYIQEIYKTVRSILDKSIIDFNKKQEKIQRDLLEAIKIKDFENMSISRLEEEKNKAIEFEQFELAAVIRNKIEEKINGNT